MNGWMDGQIERTLDGYQQATYAISVMRPNNDRLILFWEDLTADQNKSRL